MKAILKNSWHICAYFGHKWLIIKHIVKKITNCIVNMKNN